MHARWATGRRLSNYKYTAHTGPPIVLTALHNLYIFGKKHDSVAY